MIPDGYGCLQNTSLKYQCKDGVIYFSNGDIQDQKDNPCNEPFWRVVSGYETNYAEWNTEQRTEAKRLYNLCKTNWAEWKKYDDARREDILRRVRAILTNEEMGILEDMLS